jgi:hypothetical protein
MTKLTKRQLTYSIYILGFILYGLVFFLGLNQLSETRRVATSTANLTKTTNQLIKSQNDILTAIQRVSTDTKLTAQQQTAIIICMLQVPQRERTPDIQQNCTTSVAVGTTSGTAANSGNTKDSPVSSGSSSAPPSPNPTTPRTPPQSNTPHPNIFRRIISGITNVTSIF